MNENDLSLSTFRRRGGERKNLSKMTYCLFVTPALNLNYDIHKQETTRTSFLQRPYSNNNNSSSKK